jgi:phage/plasmid-associated DNA primase
LLELLTTPEARSALLSLAIKGLQRLEARQEFTTCPSVQEAGQVYRRQCDNAFEFVSEHLEAKLTDNLGKVDLYDKYIRWAQDAGIQHPANQRTFNKRISDTFEVAEGRANGVRVWTGLAWKPERSESPFDGAEIITSGIPWEKEQPKCLPALPGIPGISHSKDFLK